MTIAAAVKYCPVCGKDYPEGDVCSNDGATLMTHAPAADPLLGQTLKGTYKVQEMIAQGGMGVVYRATQIPLDRTVAIKAVFANPLASSDLVQRFFREARLLSQVDHPNVVNLIDFGNTESGAFFLVMEYLTGRTLDKAVPPERGLPTEAVVDVMEEIGAGVAAAHACNMVHRDLKPSNIFLANLQGGGVTVKLLDFGIAKALDGGGGLTQNGAIIGSTGYIAPEQINGSSEADPRSDVYALGGILYFLLAGQPAYRGGNTRAVLSKQLTEPPAPVDFAQLDKIEAVPLMAVILKAMDHDPARRYASVGEFLLAVRKAVGRPLSRNPSGSRGAIVIPEPSASTRSTIVPAVSGERTASGAAVSPSKQLIGPSTQAPPAAEPAAWMDPKFQRWAVIGGFVGLMLLTYIAGMLVWQAASGGPAAPAPVPSPRAPSPETVKRPRNATPQQGVADDHITLGMSAAFSGPARELGRGMKLGLDTAFQEANDRGGVAGRKVRLTALDDEYEPSKALPNMVELNEQRKVFAVVGNVGTPTAEVTVPYALDRGLLFFAPFTGAKLLRKDPPDRFVFNFRASYAEETAATIKYLVEIRKIKPEQIAVFSQKDGYGDAGFAGVVKALRIYNRDPDQILHVRYPRNTLKIDDAANEILKHKDEIKAVVMVPAYKPAAKFIQKLKDEKFSPVFTSVSFVGSEALAEELKQVGPAYGEGVIVTQVVPHYDSQSTAVLEYRQALRKYCPDEKPTFISLEGYLSGRLLLEGMNRTGDDLTTARLIDALESMKEFDMGIGAPVTFSRSEHQGSHKVWGTVLDKTCRYQTLDLD